jgi:transposase
MKKDELRLSGSVLVLDNHSSHSSKKVQEALLNENITVLYLAPYSCEFNPIERLWALMKRHWKKEMMNFRGDVSYIKKIELIDEVCIHMT